MPTLCPLLRRAPWLGLVLVGVMLAGCSPNPKDLLGQIERGEAAAALDKLGTALAKAPDDPVLQLLAAHARLQACAQRNCTTQAEAAPLLQPVAALLAAAPGRYSVGEAEERWAISANGVVASATIAFAALPTQPAALLALQASLPVALQEAQGTSLWQPALQQLRQGNAKAASAQLAALAQTATLPNGLRYTATLLRALLNGDQDNRASMAAALRAKPDLANAAPGALVLLPHVLRQAARATSAETLAALPVMLENSGTLGPLANPTQAAAAAHELAQLAAQPSWQHLWAQGWDPTASGPLALALQRTSLRLNANQPDLWQAYLPALVSAAASHTTLPELAAPFPTGRLSGPSTGQLGNALLQAAQRLQNRPELAAPLLQLASQLNLPSPQQVQLDKLASSLLIKAATAKQITATLALAQARPQAAANNRQLVVPLLVETIRTNLRQGDFDQAVSTSLLINTTLELPLDLAALVLEEFNASNNTSGLAAQLNATSPTLLLQPREAVALDLGPLWGFMTEYFAAQPEILRGQLNTLVASAKGVYGPPTAMHRLMPLFPAADQPGLVNWLNAALVGAAQQDSTLDAAGLSALAGNLAVVHPTLPLAPLLETALGRASTLAESRTLWGNATAPVRTVIRAIRPQFAALMKAMDADAANQPDLAASNLNQLTEATWLEQAAPVFDALNERLGAVAGVYVPLSAAPEAPLASLLVNPLGLQGGLLGEIRLTFLNRLGTLASTNPATLASTPATLQRLTLAAPFNFGTRTLDLTPPILAAAPGGASLANVYGNFGKLQFKPSPNGTLLEAHLRDGVVLRLSRILANPADVLIPDGQYALTTPLEQTLTPQPAEATHILPPGSILTLQTAPTTQPASTDYGFSGDVYPLLGTLQHPARSSPISFTGEFDPATLTSAFTFSYPLPTSGQTVRAAVKCQTLGGPITCGAHHLHSPRLAYATLIRGLQTQESLRERSAARQEQNSPATATLLAAAQAARQAQAARAASQAEIQATKSVSSSAVTPIAPRGATVASPTNVVSATSPELTATDDEAWVTEETAATSFTPTTLASSPTGLFIHRGNKALSDTNPSPTNAASPTVAIPR